MYTLKDLVLVVDDRESALFPHLSCEAQEISYVKKRITTGDYALLCKKTNQMLAVFERKSLADFGASLKDGRILNKQDLITMREKTGCRIIYIIEGPMAPSPSQCFSNIPYDRIQSNIFHMMMRDNIMPLYTLNTQHTITTLVAFIKSTLSLLNTQTLTDIKADSNNEIQTGGSEEKTTSEQNLDELLTATVTKSDLDVVRTMWSKFRGVSAVTADIFIAKISLADLICGKVTPDDIKNFKSAGGKSLGKNVVESLSSITTGYNKILEEKILAEVVGISDKTAKSLLTGRNLKQLLSYEPGAISIIKVGDKQRNIGMKRATDILKYFNFKIGTPSDHTLQSQPVQIQPTQTQLAQPEQTDADKIKTISSALKKL